MAVIAPSIYAAIVTCLGFACFALSATAIGLPVWARFRSYGGNVCANFPNEFIIHTFTLLQTGFEDYGYFGPWKTCRQLVYSYREKCGPEVSHFRPSGRLHLFLEFRPSTNKYLSSKIDFSRHHLRSRSARHVRLHCFRFVLRSLHPADCDDLIPRESMYPVHHSSRPEAVPRAGRCSAGTHRGHRFRCDCRQQPGPVRGNARGVLPSAAGRRRSLHLPGFVGSVRFGSSSPNRWRSHNAADVVEQRQRYTNHCGQSWIQRHTQG